MGVFHNPFRANFASHWGEAEIPVLKIPSFLLERASVKNADNLAGILIGNIWDELEGVCERADDEAVITVRISALNRASHPDAQLTM